MSIVCPYPSCLTPGGQQKKFYLQPRCIEHCLDVHHGGVVVDEFNNIVFNHLGLPLIKGYNQLVVANVADAIQVHSDNEMIVENDVTTSIVPYKSGPFSTTDAGSGSGSCTATRQSERLLIKDTDTIFTISFGNTFANLSVEDKEFVHRCLEEKHSKATKAAKKSK